MKGTSFFMDLKAKEAKLLEQLGLATGINFEIAESELSDEETVKKLKEILAHFNVIDSKSSFYKLFITGELSYSDAAPSLHRFHIKESSIRQLFYVESTQDFSKDAISLIRSLLQDSADILVEMDAKHLVIITHFDSAPSNEEVMQYSNEVLDMLETEVFCSAKIAYDEPVETFKDLPIAYKSAVISMHIGNIFLTQERVFCYSDLGLSRLLYNVPETECIAYLNKTINFNILRNLDEETINTLDAFFANDLSLAETSRKLFVHRNTLIYRLDKFADLTGLDVRKFSDAMNVKISLMIYNYIRNKI